MLVAIGTRPCRDDLGLDSVGVDDADALDVDPYGRVPAAAGGHVWAAGDVAGHGQYTHLANHQARVVAANIQAADRGEAPVRRFDDVVLPRCTFTDPPVMAVGPTWRDLGGDDDAGAAASVAADVVWAAAPLADLPRRSTDELGPGVLVMAARRSTGTIVAAHGIGARFDELSHAVTAAIDGRVPVRVLARQMRAFPTVGEVLGVVTARLHAALDGP